MDSRPELTARSSSVSRHEYDVPEGLLLDGPVDPQVMEIIPDLTSPINEDTTEPNVDPTRELPWWKRPSSGWLLYGTLIAAIAMTSTIAPRVEIYVKLACQEIRPEYNSLPSLAGEGGGAIDWPSNIGAVTIPRPSAKCQADPEVQAAVASLGAVITTIMGTLSCLTAGWWGRFSDHYGRVKVLALTLIGVLVADLVFITVALASDRIPGGFRFLVVAPVVEGILGGIATGSAATHAYLSDTTTAANRSRTFSLMLGLLFIGLALGPTLGGLLISTTGNLLSVFYVAATIHFVYFLLALFVIPESLTPERKQANIALAKKKAEEQRLRDESNPKRHTLEWKARKVASKLFFFLRPLEVFVPIKTKAGRNWNLAILAVAYGLVTMLVSGYQFKFQYAFYTFGWTSTQVGYWISVAGVLRATHLILILPAIIKYFHPANRSRRSRPDVNRSNSRLHSTSQSTSRNRSQSTSAMPKSLPHSPHFDLLIARFSLLIELLAYIAVLLSTNAYMFIAATVIGAFGGGFSPSLQSLAVELEKRKQDEIRSQSHLHSDEGEDNEEALASHPAGEGNAAYGALFGALAVVQALCSQMIGPTVFGTIFVKTIDHFPKGIFVFCAAAVIVGLGCLFLIRVPSEKKDQERGEREPLLEQLQEEERYTDERSDL